MTQPQPQAPGGQRADAALLLGAAVAAVMAGLETALLALLAHTLVRLLAGGGRRPLARAVHVQAVALVERAVGQVRRDLARAGRQITADAERTLADVIGRAIRRTPTIGLPPTSGRLDPSMGSVADLIERAGLNAIRDVDDAFAEAARIATAEGTNAQALQRMLDQFAEHGLTGFTDAAGRHWDLASYSQMAVRTAATRLSLLTQLQLMGPAGMDLVVVDSPSGRPGCRTCRPFEGRVLSLSGRHVVGQVETVTDAHGRRQQASVVASLADAVAAGLLHPNCRHYLVPFTDGAGHLPLVGTQRGFVSGGRLIYRPVPAPAESAAYETEQHQRAVARAARAAAARETVGLTPMARARARRQAVAVRRHAESIRKAG